MSCTQTKDYFYCESMGICSADCRYFLNEKVKPVPIMELLMPLINHMSEEELNELYKDLTNNE